MPGAPQPGGYVQQPTGAPQPAAPRRSAKVPILIAAIVVLALALLATGGIGLAKINSVRSDVAKLKAANAAAQKEDNDAAEALKAKFKDADLAGKLARIKDLDRATDDVFKQWSAGTAKFGALTNAISACDDAVDEYDWTAAPFPASMFTDLPQKIDLTKAETDCGRAFASRI
jgi:outer membrane murein-binding lipoprotein Lpp